MAHSFNRYTTGFTTLKGIALATHAALTSAGWVMEFADADALIDGSGGAPGFGKAPTAFVSAGQVTYRMPARAQFQRWVLQMRYSWVGSTTSFDIQLVSAKSHAFGALVDAGTVFNVRVATSSISGDSHIIANDDGVMLHLAASANTWSVLGFERSRLPDQTVIEDCVSYSFGQVSMTYNNRNLRRNFAQGERLMQGLTMQMPIDFTGSVALLTTLNSADGATGYPLGISQTSGGQGGHLRLVQAWLSNDAPPASEWDINVDGGFKTHIASSYLWSALNPVRLMFPKG